MQRNPAAWLEDIRECGEAIQADTKEISFDEYLSNHLIRRTTERHFEIIGEALVNLRDQRPDLFARIDRGHRIIGFGNTLIHGYFALDQPTIWDAIEFGLPDLLKQTYELLEEVRNE